MICSWRQSFNSGDFPICRELLCRKGKRVEQGGVSTTGARKDRTQLQGGRYPLWEMNPPCAGPTAIQYKSKELALLGVERNAWKQVPPGYKKGTEMEQRSSRERDWLQILTKL